jgi:hypothetical protein
MISPAILIHFKRMVCEIRWCFKQCPVMGCLPMLPTAPALPFLANRFTVSLARFERIMAGDGDDESEIDSRLNFQVSKVMGKTMQQTEGAISAGNMAGLVKIQEKEHAIEAAFTKGTSIFSYKISHFNDLTDRSVRLTNLIWFL